MNAFKILRMPVSSRRSLFVVLTTVTYELAVASGACFGGVDVKLYAALRAVAVPTFTQCATTLLQSDYACRILKTDTARPGDSFSGELHHYGAAGVSLVKWKLRKAISVSATNEGYSFDVYRKNDARSFELSSLAERGTWPRLNDLLLPECQVGGIPGWVFFDIRYFRIRECKMNSDGTVNLNAECICDVDLATESYGIFGGKCVRGVLVELVLRKDARWKITAGRVNDSSYRWQQSPGGHEREIIFKMSGLPDRIVRYQVTVATAIRYDEVREQFYLSYYGLSESTAGYLMGSRRYILVFCGLFIGAVLFRIVAYVVKQRRAKSPEATE